jgi:hypothetical protein
MPFHAFKIDPRELVHGRPGEYRTLRVLRLFSLPRALGRLPERFQWTLHNLVGHPVSELLFQVGLQELSGRVHDRTMPADEGSRRRPAEWR